MEYGVPTTAASSRESLHLSVTNTRLLESLLKPKCRFESLHSRSYLVRSLNNISDASSVSNFRMSVNNAENPDSDTTDSSAKPLTRTFSNARMAELNESSTTIPRRMSDFRTSNPNNPRPQAAPGVASVGHDVIENSIPLSIFPIATDKFCICFCGLPGRGKTHISRRLAKYLSFFHAVSVELFNVSEYRRKVCGALKDAEWFNPKNKEAW